MIREFVDRFMVKKDELERGFLESPPSSYLALVEKVVEMIATDPYGGPDPERVHEIDDGDYQGTLVYVIGGKGYQPHSYWFVRVDYGSCSGCDTLESALEEPADAMAKGLVTLALHVVQGIKGMDGDGFDEDENDE